MIDHLRPVAASALLLLQYGCAQMEPPPGGPEDRMPPYVVAQRPDSLAVVPDWDRPVVFEFSERISEQQVEESVMVSPRTSPVAVDRGSRDIRVSLRRGWEPGQIYQVTIRPLIQDLFNNQITSPIEVVFSTGPEIPDTRFVGTVLDRITGEAQPDARVEAIRIADSLVYAVPSDSVGEFVFAHIPEGEYLIRAFPDQNRNRMVDPFEPRDSAVASVGTTETGSAELSIVLPDSTPPIIASVRAGGERRVEVRFDDYLDPAQQLDSTSVSMTGPDGVPVPIARATVGEPVESEADTVAAADLPAEAQQDTVPEVDGPIEAEADTLPGALPVVETDTVAIPEPRLPSQLVVVELAEGVALTPDAEYTVTATSVRNIVGLSGDSEAEFEAPEPPPPPEEEADTVPPPEPAPGR